MNPQMQVRVTDYVIVTEHTPAVCSDKVRALLTDGWVLHGALTAIMNPGDYTTTYVQALVKLEVTPPPGFGSQIATPFR